MTIDRRILAATACLGLLAGCEHGFRDPRGELSKFGEPNRQTMMAQVVDPDPRYEDALATSANHAAQAIDRYRADRVKQPERTSSRSIGGGN